ncbi:hypothetical protein CDD81_7701 [Ophiocordyceps australis]|uniref:Uncharacterized protein n=1 Tax=Ophiocordyceps australis TaxID=1399860 RepID=A0A2C5Y3Z3_9HYPO|nr:hypothetical protein CDD81_7701 [Ophiocordyceps australis]
MKTPTVMAIFAGGVLAQPAIITAQRIGSDLDCSIVLRNQVLVDDKDQTLEFCRDQFSFDGNSTQIQDACGNLDPAELKRRVCTPSVDEKQIKSCKDILYEFLFDTDPRFNNIASFCQDENTTINGHDPRLQEGCQGITYREMRQLSCLGFDDVSNKGVFSFTDGPDKAECDQLLNTLFEDDDYNVDMAGQICRGETKITHPTQLQIYSACGEIDIKQEACKKKGTNKGQSDRDDGRDQAECDNLLTTLLQDDDYSVDVAGRICRGELPVTQPTQGKIHLACGEIDIKQKACNKNGTNKGQSGRDDSTNKGQSGRDDGRDQAECDNLLTSLLQDDDYSVDVAGQICRGELPVGQSTQGQIHLACGEIDIKQKACNYGRSKRAILPKQSLCDQYLSLLLHDDDPESDTAGLICRGEMTVRPNAQNDIYSACGQIDIQQEACKGPRR